MNANKQIAVSDAKSHGIDVGFACQQRDFGNRFMLTIYGHSIDERWMVQPLQLVALGIGDDTYVGPDTLDMRPGQAQALMDALYESGLRPTRGLGSPGQVDALSAHLGDMRRIVSKSLDVTLLEQDRVRR